MTDTSTWDFQADPMTLDEFRAWLDIHEDGTSAWVDDPIRLARSIARIRRHERAGVRLPGGMTADEFRAKFIEGTGEDS